MTTTWIAVVRVRPDVATVLNDLAAQLPARVPSFVSWSWGDAEGGDHDRPAPFVVMQGEVATCEELEALADEPSVRNARAACEGLVVIDGAGPLRDAGVPTVPRSVVRSIIRTRFAPGVPDDRKEALQRSLGTTVLNSSEVLGAELAWCSKDMGDFGDLDLCCAFPSYEALQRFQRGSAFGRFVGDHRADITWTYAATAVSPPMAAERTKIWTDSWAPTRRRISFESVEGVGAMDVPTTTGDGVARDAAAAVRIAELRPANVLSAATDHPLGRSRIVAAIADLVGAHPRPFGSGPTPTRSRTDGLDVLFSPRHPHLSPVVVNERTGTRELVDPISRWDGQASRVTE